MTNLSYTFEEFKTVFCNEKDHKKLCKLIAPLLKNWEYKNRWGSFWHDILQKCSVTFKEIYKTYFPSNFQEKKFTEEDKELIVHLLKFLQRAYLFSKSELTFFDDHKILRLALSFDTEVSIQTFKLISLFGNTNLFFNNEDCDKYLEILIKMINAENLQIKNYTISSKFEISNYEDSLNFYNQNRNLKTTGDFYLGCLKRDIFYTIKRVYAFLIFKLSINKDSINKIRIKKFSEEMIKELKTFIIENAESEIIDEVKFCLDRLALFLIYCKFDRSEILRILEVESEQEYLRKIINYNENTKFEEILGFRIFESFLDIRDKTQLELVCIKNNPDFDYSYMSLVYNYIKLDKLCIENYLVEINEYRAVIENLEKYVEHDDINVLRMLFKIINNIYYTQQELLEPFETSTYLTKLSSMLDTSKPSLFCCSLKTISFFMKNDPYNVSRIVKHGNLFRIVENSSFWKLPLFGSISRLIQRLFEDVKIRKRIIGEKIFKNFLDHVFYYSFDNNNIIGDDSIVEFSVMVTSNAEFFPLLVNFRFSYLFNRGNRRREMHESEILGDINFFKLFMMDNFEGEQYGDFVYENTEFTLDVFDKILLYGFPKSLEWHKAFFNTFYQEDAQLYDIDEIPILYFMQKLVKLLPQINDQRKENVEELKETLIILERYLYVICNTIVRMKDDAGYVDNYLRIYNICLILALNLLPSLFRFRNNFKVKSDFVRERELTRIIDLHLNLNDKIENLLDLIWTEVIFLMCISLKWDDHIGGKMTVQFLEHIYKKEIKGIHRGSKSISHYSLPYEKNISQLRSDPNKFHKDLVNWNPIVKIIELSEDHKEEYQNFIVDFAKKYLQHKYCNGRQSLLQWITANQLFKEEVAFYTADDLCETLRHMEENDEDSCEMDLPDESLLVQLIFPKPGNEKRNMKIINSLLNFETELSHNLHTRIVNYYVKHFDFSEEVNFKGVFENTDFVNKLIAEKKFKSFRNCKIIDIPLYFMNHVFIDTREYINMYCFVLENISYSKIKTDKKKLQEIFLDPKLRNKNQEVYTEMKIDTKVLPKYVKYVMKSKNITKMDKIEFCNSIIKYLNNLKIIMKVDFYKKILKFGIENVSEDNQDDANIFIKCLMHQLLESPYDVMIKKNIFDAHLQTYKEFLDYYQVLGYTNINALKARLERKMCNIDIRAKDNSNSGYKYVIEKLQEEIFNKLMKYAVKNLNALNMLTEILMNNLKYSKQISEKYINTILKKQILKTKLTDKISDHSDFEISLKFVLACLKSDDKELSKISFNLIKQALKDCPNDRIYNLIIVLFRSLDFINVVTHEDDVYVTSKKLNELSTKYILNNVMNIIVERITNCKEEDLKIYKNLANFCSRNVDSDILDSKLNWNNYDDKLTYAYTFISTAYNNYFVDSLKYNYDSRSEIWPIKENFNKIEHDITKRTDYDLSDEVDYFMSLPPNPNEFTEDRYNHKRSKISYVFKKIFQSYFLYKQSFSLVTWEARHEYNTMIDDMFKAQYGIKNFSDPIKKIAFKSWENEEYSNISEILEIKTEEKESKIEEVIQNNTRPVVNTIIGIKNGAKPFIEWYVLNKMKEAELKKFVDDWNNSRKKLNAEYYGIDIDFLAKCNTMQRNVFIRAEEILKTRYTIFGNPKSWPAFSESQSQSSTVNNSTVDSNEIVNDTPQYSPTSCNKLTKYDLHVYLKSRFLKLTSSPYEIHASADYLSKLNYPAKGHFIQCEDRIAKTYALNLYLKEIAQPRKIDETGIESVTISKFLEAFSKNPYLCYSAISDFFKVLCRNSKIALLVATAIERNLFASCQRKEINFLEIKNSLELLTELKNECAERIENNVNWTRLLIVLSRIPEICEFTLPVLDVLQVNDDLMTAVPLFDTSLRINSTLTDIPEDEIPKKLLWNFKEFLKFNCSSIAYNYFLDFIGDQLMSYILDLISMCLQDKEILTRSMKKIAELSEQFFNSVEGKYRNNIQLMKKKYILPNILLFKMDFQCLLGKGIFTDSQSTSRITATIFDCLHEILQNYDLCPKDFILLFETYEGFINLLTIMTTYKRNERIVQYSILRPELEERMIKNQDLYNELFQKDLKCASFLVKFNIITFTNKRKYFRDQVREAIGYVPDEETEIYEIFVNRDYIVEDSFENIMQGKVSSLKFSRIRVSFVDEDGYDEGGLTKEWLECLAKGVSNQNFGLFTYSSEKHTTLLPFKGSNVNMDHLKYFKFIGRIMGKAILDGYNFPLNLDKTVYKFILNKKCDLSDLESVDPQFYNSLVWMRDNSIKDVLHLTFTYENNDFGELKVEDLKFKGRDIQVTDENKNEYIDLIIQKKFINNIFSQLNALKSGLLEIVEENLINIFDEKELELLICGVPEIDVEDWKINTIYNGYNKNSQNIKWFWEAVTGFSSDEKAKLLHFCTGSSRVPFDGFANLQGNSGQQRFIICKMNTKRLPTAHTCFNQLDLPEYSSYEELRKNIIYAINECHGTYGFA